uniref:hypothetical protein n=1 Tax=uncultured Draconibacterium sp. TaxID=1573823 RepID=UPI003216AD46
MKRSISIMSFLRTALFALFVGIAFSATAGLPALPVVGGLFATGFIPMPNGVSLMAIQKEIWLKDVVENLYMKNEFLKYAFSADEFVLEGKVVHIPNAGAKIGAKKNRTTLPATAITRADNDLTFALDEYTSTPVKISNAEKYELSYDKRRSVIGESADGVAELMGNWMLYDWAPTVLTQMYRTTGGTVPAHIGTGNRKLCTAADVKKMQKMMNKNGVPATDRYALLDADMYDQFTDDLSITQEREFSKYYDAEKGIVGKLFGFTFLESRPTVLEYTNAATPVPVDPDTATADTNHGGAIFWQKDCVIKAVGDTEFFDDEGNPLYFGDIYSSLLRAGGRKRRYDGKGVIALIQATFA